MLMKVICQLNKEKLRGINKLKSEKEIVFIERCLKSEHKHWLLIRLKAIKHKKNFVRYLFSYISPYSFLIFIA